MSEQLVVSVLGNRHTGKTTTWHALFNAAVNTGKHERKLYLNRAQWVKVFLVSGSPEERKLPIETLLNAKLPQIVLCSTQYRASAKNTFDHFFKNEYEVFVQWLNPGHGDPSKYQDAHGLGGYLLDEGATLQIRSGRGDPLPRVTELRQFLLGWATYRGLLRTDFPS